MDNTYLLTYFFQNGIVEQLEKWTAIVYRYNSEMRQINRYVDEYESMFEFLKPIQFKVVATFFRSVKITPFLFVERNVYTA